MKKESIWDVVWNKKYKPEDSSTIKGKKRNTLALFYIPMLIIAILFIIVFPFSDKAQNEKITHEFSVKEIQTELSSLSDTIDSLKSRTEEISSKSISMLSDVTAEKQTIDSINAQIKTINEQIQQILPFFEKSEEIQEE